MEVSCSGLAYSVNDAGPWGRVRDGQHEFGKSDLLAEQITDLRQLHHALGDHHLLLEQRSGGIQAETKQHRCDRNLVGVGGLGGERLSQTLHGVRRLLLDRWSDDRATDRRCPA